MGAGTLVVPSFSVFSRADLNSLARAVALFVTLVAVGCPRGGPERDTMRLPLVTTDDPRAEADMRSAREAADAGRAEEAERLYRQFLVQHPQDPLVPIARLGLGRLLLAEGETGEARQHFQAVATHADPSVAERGRFYDGVALHLEGQHEEALGALRPFVGRTVDPAETAILLRTIAAASDRLGDRTGAIEALDALLREPVPEEDAREARARLETLVRTEATPEEILRAAEMLPRAGAAWPLVAERALRLAYESGDLERVRELAHALRERGVELDDDLSAMALRAERTHEADVRAIGAILPLSGRGREVGQHALRGMMLASGSPLDGPMPEGAPQLVFRDGAGDPERAVQAVEDLVSLHRVVAILGPLSGASAERAARRAQELGVPLITLSPAENVTSVGPMIFRLFFTPQTETRELVAAARARGATRYAVLHPDNAYGSAMARAFATNVRSLGGQVVATKSYPADATAFGREIEELRRQDLDAVFVPDSARKIALIAPALATAGLWSVGPESEAPRNGRGITLLVPSVGFDPQLVRSTGRYLQGALFSAPFFAPTATGVGREFADDFQQRYGAAPDVWAAYGYDAMRLVLRAVEAGATDRSGVADRLRTLRGVDTAASSQGFLPNGEPVRGTRVLELQGNLFVPRDVPPSVM